MVGVQLREHPDWKLKAFLKEELDLEEARLSGSAGGYRLCWSGDLKLERGIWKDLKVRNEAGL